jgi:hypothetical protein
VVNRFAPVLTMSQPKRSDDPVVARGQDAWERLQEDAPRRRALSRGPGDKARARREQSQATHRRWWLDVGEALAVGRRTSVSNQSFSAWITDNGFDDLNYKTRQGAVWLVANIEALGELPDGLATPSTIRQWENRRRAVAMRRANSKPDSVTGPVSATDVTSLGKAVALLRSAARDARRSAEATDAAAQLIAKVNIAIKRRGGP